MRNLKRNIDNKIMANKIEYGINELKNKSADELKDKINKMNRDELMKKINEIDINRIKELNLDINAIKQKITPQDLEKIKIIAGKDREKIMSKINQIFNNQK